MVGSVYLGLLNITNLNHYLIDLFQEHNISITVDLFIPPVLYGDDIFPNLATILPRYSNPYIDERRINSRLSFIRQPIEHFFALHNIFKLFNHPTKIKLMHRGKDSIHLIFNYFLLLNYYNCFHTSNSSFGMSPPSLEEY